tara:strand:- start:1034 stop:1228 length:195 start_codon:yes stop_codon:yes gene_type:complete
MKGTLTIEEEKKAKQTIQQRLGEIDKKDIKYLEKQANIWDKTLVDKSLLTKLKDFDFWKEWKHK